MPGLIMPAFSPAIFSSVLPSCATWSKLTFVMMLSSGDIILVLSSLPPSPVSITATSTPISLKYLNAIMVVISKKEGCNLSISGFAFSTKSITYCSSIGLPFTLMRSEKSFKCGDV